ncbi:hypothetical protein BC936DRAFT_138737, partial [Jimgerdemannia flammicorona]
RNAVLETANPDVDTKKAHSSDWPPHGIFFCKRKNRFSDFEVSLQSSPPMPMSDEYPQNNYYPQDDDYYTQNDDNGDDDGDKELQNDENYDPQTQSDDKPQKLLSFGLDPDCGEKVRNMDL